MVRRIRGRTPRLKQADLFDRLEARAGAARLRIAGRPPALVAVRVIRRSVNVRVTGLAAEMTYYMVLSLIPLLTAVGAALGLMQRIIGDDGVARVESALTNGIETVLSPEVSRDVMVPLVQNLLREERTGVAIGGLAVAIWLASRVFRAAIRALDDAYEVEERRPLLQQLALSVGFALAAVLVITIVLSLVVVGPLLGGAREIASWFGGGEVFSFLWEVLRLPMVYLACSLFLMWLYLVGPNVNNRWWETLPGAFVATTLVLLIAAGFRTYIAVAGPQGPQVGDGEAVLRAVGQFIGSALAGLLFIWLSAIAVLLGGVVDAEWRRAKPVPDAPRDPRPEDRRSPRAT